MSQTWENGEKTNFGPDFGPIFFSWVLPLLDIRHCRNLSLYAISRKTYGPNSIKWWKPHFGLDLGPLGSIQAAKFFFPQKNSGSVSQ